MPDPLRQTTSRRAVLRAGCASAAGLALGAAEGLAAETLAAPAAVPKAGSTAPGVISTDLCVYGGTSAGVAAAVQARRMGKRAVILEPGRHLGGMTASGLGLTDIGNRTVIGGLSREFYARVREHYIRAYGADSPQVRDCRDGFRFEPKVAEKVFDALAKEAGVPVYFRHRLQRVVKRRNDLVELVMENGTVVRAAMFLDATYEGDLLAAAGVSYVVGREGNAKYGETLNGVQFGRPFHNFRVPVDPYVVEGEPSSGLLKGISEYDGGKQGEADNRVQAYNFRLCLTNVAENRLPFPRPREYDPERYTLLARYIREGVWDAFRPVDGLPNGKVDLNNNGAFSTDNIGMSYDYPEGDAAAREQVVREHASYQQGLFWFLCHDERVPPEIRRQVRQWGLARDEFTDNGGWPHQIYVRESRRLVADYVMTEHNCLGSVSVDDSIGMAAYAMDSHNVQRVVRDGRVLNEGDVQVAGFPPYGISYRAIIPREAECRNLLAPVCLSASHIAYGSIRMEPVFMILGQSAATAAVMAIDAQTGVQRVNVAKLQQRLLQDRQVLGDRSGTGTPLPLVLDPKSLKGIVVDDTEAEKTGSWASTALPNPRRVGEGYLHDDDAAKGLLSASFTPDLPAEGSYNVVLIFPPNPGAATNVPVTIQVEGVGSASVRVNQRASEQNGFVSLGTFKLPAGRRTTVTISNKGTDGYVIADAVQFLPLAP
jgi:hypothetical protein